MYNRVMERISLFEAEIISLPPLKNKLLDHQPEEKHLELNGYQPHAGLRPRSKHWRKPKDKGCFHITLHQNGKCRMHWDAWDPRRYPVRHFCEVFYRYLRFPRFYLNQQ